MKTHYRNYDTIVNGKSINHHISIEALSDRHIKRMMDYYIKKFKSNGMVNEKDTITFKFKYCHHSD